MTAAPHPRVIVALDTQLAVGTATGIGVYQRDLANALRAENVDVRELHAPRLNPWRFDRRVLWDQVLLPLQAARSGARLLHASAGTMPFIRTLPTIVTVHDLAWHRVQSHTRAYARTYFGKLQARAYKHAAAIICDSNFSANEYRELVDASAQIDVVYPGVDARFARIERFPDPAPFALVVGTVEERKNLLVLIEALPSLPALRIIAVGPPTPYADAVRARAAELNVTDRVELRGYVEREQLDRLYACATCALIPSRYEGFGYALAEAMCAGIPAIAARSSSLVEVAADDVPLVKPDDITAWVDAIGALLADGDAAQQRADALRERAIARFSWGTAASQMLAIYLRVARS
ncbi:MAG: glycosyltransferase family 4 protein [Candidatus Eremiobacteraeota bacterium]|nr:glycosyltransferase family 4 protein [Candidatus Eremiobacteraeota bacterium]